MDTENVKPSQLDVRSAGMSFSRSARRYIDLSVMNECLFPLLIIRTEDELLDYVRFLFENSSTVLEKPSFDLLHPYISALIFQLRASINNISDFGLVVSVLFNNVYNYGSCAAYVIPYKQQ